MGCFSLGRWTLVAFRHPNTASRSDRIDVEGGPSSRLFDCNKLIDRGVGGRLRHEPGSGLTDEAIAPGIAVIVTRSRYRRHMNRGTVMSR